MSDGTGVQRKRISPLLTGRYLHYKGEHYQVLGEAEHTETGERVVVYIPLYPIGSDLLRARPRAMWDEFVWWEPSPGVPLVQLSRFVYVGGD